MCFFVVVFFFHEISRRQISIFFLALPRKYIYKSRESSSVVRMKSHIFGEHFEIFTLNVKTFFFLKKKNKNKCFRILKEIRYTFKGGYCQIVLSAL